MSDTQLFSLADLRRRGWSPAMVRDLLGDPDARRPNPRLRTAAPMSVYLAERVRAAEESKDFARRARQAARRSAAARRVAERCREQTLRAVRSATVRVPTLDEAVLARRAVAHRNTRQAAHAAAHGAEPDPVRLDEAPDELRHRWEVNYLRHMCTPYDALLDGLHGRVGRERAVQELRGRVYAAISERYPHLRTECDRQLDERGPPVRLRRAGPEATSRPPEARVDGPPLATDGGPPTPPMAWR